MLPIILRVDHAENGRVKEYLAETSPVRIGRNTLNELHLPYKFVSAQHGVLRFDDDGIYYCDLDTLNGSALGTSELPRGVEVQLPLEAHLRIGPLTISFVRIQDQSETLVPPRPPLEDPETVEVNIAHLRARVDKLRPAYETYRESSRNLIAQVMRQLSGLSDKDRAEVLELIMRVMPEAAQERELRDLARNAGLSVESVTDPRSAQAMKESAPRLIPWAPAPKNEAETERLLERVVDTLQAFCDAFIGLRDAHDEFCQQTGIQVVRGLSPLSRAQDPAELLSHLLDWRPSGAGRLQELTRVFADVSTHQLALWDGINAGVRALLKALSPEEIDRDLRDKGGLPLLKTRARWARFCELHEFMTDEATLATVFFGREFIKAYASVAGRKVDERAPITISLRRGRGSGTQAHSLRDSGSLDTAPGRVARAATVAPLSLDDEDEESAEEVNLSAVIEARELDEDVEDEDPESISTNVKHDPRKRR